MPVADWDAQVLAELEQVEQGVERDIRAAPDSHRRGRFRLGWNDAALRHREYDAATLASLTWHNLGYRLGKRFGVQDPQLVDRAFDCAVERLRMPPQDGAPGAAVGASDIEEAGFRPHTLQERRDAKHHLAVERRAKAAQLCLQRDAWTCRICGVRMRDCYGLDEDMAEAHFTGPLGYLTTSQRRGVQASDLVTLCSNCHRAVHRRGCGPGLLNELRARLRQSGAD